MGMVTREIPTTIAPIDGRMTEIEELENLEEDPLQRYKPSLSHPTSPHPLLLPLLLWTKTLS